VPAVATAVVREVELPQVTPVQDLNFAGSSGDKRLFEGRLQLTKIREAGGASSQNDYGYVEVRNVLLIRQILVYRDEHIEFGCSQAEKSAVLNMLPTELLYRPGFMTRQITQQTPVDAFVNQDLHSA